MEGEVLVMLKLPMTPSHQMWPSSPLEVSQSIYPSLAQLFPAAKVLWLASSSLPNYSDLKVVARHHLSAAAMWRK
jgi:hypothetical protein